MQLVFVAGLALLPYVLAVTKYRYQRPVKSPDQVIKASVFLRLKHIEEVNELEQTMTIQGVLSMVWNDEISNFSDVSLTNYMKPVKYYRNWFPRLEIFNNAEGASSHMFTYKQPMYKMYKRRMYFARRFSVKLTCKFEFSKYPFDVQRCPMVLYSYQYTINELELTKRMDGGPKITLSSQTGYDKMSVAGWNVLNLTQDMRYYSAGKLLENRSEIVPSHTFSVCEFWITVQRVNGYYGILLVLPCLVTSFLTLLALWVQDLGTMSFLFLSSILLQGIFMADMVMKTPPTTGTLPRILQFHTFNLTCTMLALVFMLMAHIVIQQRVGSKVPVPRQIQAGLDPLFRILPQKTLSFDNALYDCESMLNREIVCQPTAESVAAMQQASRGCTQASLMNAAPTGVEYESVGKVVENAKRIMSLCLLIAYLIFICVIIFA